MARHPLEAGVDVSADEPERMADVQTDPGGIREHVLDEHLLAERLGAVRIGECADGVRCVERAVLVPEVLPTDLDVLCKRGRVPMFRGVGAREGVGVLGVAHTAPDPTG